MNEKQSFHETSPQPPYRLYRDPGLPLAFDEILHKRAENLENAEHLLERQPDSPQFAAGYAAAEVALRHYAETAGYAIQGAPPEAPPADNP